MEYNLWQLIEDLSGWRRSRRFCESYCGRKPEYLKKTRVSDLATMYHHMCRRRDRIWLERNHWATQIAKVHTGVNVTCRYWNLVGAYVF